MYKITSYFPGHTKDVSLSSMLEQIKLNSWNWLRSETPGFSYSISNSMLNPLACLGFRAWSWGSQIFLDVFTCCFDIWMEFILIHRTGTWSFSGGRAVLWLFHRWHVLDLLCFSAARASLDTGFAISGMKWPCLWSRFKDARDRSLCQKFDSMDLRLEWHNVLA
jgi:hypothetical protein